MGESTLTPHAKFFHSAYGKKNYCVISTNFANILEKTYMKKFGEKKTWWGLSLNPTLKASVFFWFFTSGKRCSLIPPFYILLWLFISRKIRTLISHLLKNVS